MKLTKLVLDAIESNDLTELKEYMGNEEVKLLINGEEKQIAVLWAIESPDTGGGIVCISPPESYNDLDEDEMLWPGIDEEVDNKFLEHIGFNFNGLKTPVKIYIGFDYN